MEIPKEYQQLCKDLAKVLRKFNYDHGWMSDKDLEKEKIIYRFSGKMSISDHKMSDIHFGWENGRHGDGQGEISISTTISVDAKIDEDPL
tara:strand:- start:210 stop:479 length:270 start_codon:yes stop_codon:yes gene_type:complete